MKRIHPSFNYKKIMNGVARDNANVPDISSDDLSRFKECLYNMAVDLDDRFRKYGIKLFIAYGTLLGAKRHCDFIPWDDDFDFGVSREDYEKIKGIFAEEFADDYEIRVPNSENPNGDRYMQIYKKGTVLRTMGCENPLQPACVYIDIFPCDYVPGNRLHRTIKGYWCNMLMLIASCVMDSTYGDNKKIYRLSRDGKLYILLRGLIGKIFSFIRVEKWFDIVDKAVRYKNSSLVTSAMGRNHYLGEICAENKIFPLREIAFRDHLFYAPADVDYNLRRLYGDDYMTPPPEEERESHFITELKITHI